MRGPKIEVSDSSDLSSVEEDAVFSESAEADEASDPAGDTVNADEEEEEELEDEQGQAQEEEEEEEEEEEDEEEEDEEIMSAASYEDLDDSDEFQPEPVAPPPAKRKSARSKAQNASRSSKGSRSNGNGASRSRAARSQVSMAELSDDDDVKEDDDELEISPESAEAEFDEDQEILEELEADSRSETPDYGKMTARQRSKVDGPLEFVELPLEPSRKKILSVEEAQLKRSELARRRKNLSEKRLEEEKQDTLDKLLNKRAPKLRGAAAATSSAGSGVEDEKVDERRAKKVRTWLHHPALSSWSATKERIAYQSELVGRVLD